MSLKVLTFSIPFLHYSTCISEHNLNTQFNGFEIASKIFIYIIHLFFNEYLQNIFINYVHEVKC